MLRGKDGDTLLVVLMCVTVHLLFPQPGTVVGVYWRAMGAGTPDWLVPMHHKWLIHSPYPASSSSCHVKWLVATEFLEKDAFTFKE